MTASEFDFTTGPSQLPDPGKMSYNGCTFSPLFETTVSGSVVKDNAGRTTKLMDYTITADGYVTLLEAELSINDTTTTLRNLLTQQGGALIYQGRGIDLVVNGGSTNPALARTDVAWGPVPELLEFQPLGGGRAAKVKWVVKTRLYQGPAAPGNLLFGMGILQFNYETTVSYGDDGYSSLSMRGTVEVPMTRTPSQATRTLTRTVDDARALIDTQLLNGIDLSRFRVVRRNYSVSRDKRTLEFDVSVEEKPYMDLPPDCTVARGTYSVRPARAGMGMVLWLCTLRATYTVRADKPRRTAWLRFLALLRLRMNASVDGNMPKTGGGGTSNPTTRGILADLSIFSAVASAVLSSGSVPPSPPVPAPPPGKSRSAWLIDFSFDEGLYLDSKTVSFSATWRLVTTLSHILLASGLWKKIDEHKPGTPPRDGNLWALSMRDISGSESWLPNKLNPAADVIVDFGGP